MKMWKVNNDDDSNDDTNVGNSALTYVTLASKNVTRYADMPALSITGRPSSLLHWVNFVFYVVFYIFPRAASESLILRLCIFNVFFSRTLHSTYKHPKMLTDCWFLLLAPLLPLCRGTWLLDRWFVLNYSWKSKCWSNKWKKICFRKFSLTYVLLVGSKL